MQELGTYRPPLKTKKVDCFALGTATARIAIGRQSDATFRRHTRSTSALRFTYLGSAYTNGTTYTDALYPLTTVGIDDHRPKHVIDALCAPLPGALLRPIIPAVGTPTHSTRSLASFADSPRICPHICPPMFFPFTNLTGMTGRSGEIRTPDPLLPKQVRYQAALRSARLISPVRDIAGIS